MPSVSRWAECALRIVVAVAVGGSAGTLTGGGPAAALAVGGTSEIIARQPGAGDPDEHVIVVLRDPARPLLTKGRAARIEASRPDRAGAMLRAGRVGAREVRGFDTVNGFAATVTPAQADQIAADPTVAAVYPDLDVRLPQSERELAGTPSRRAPDATPSRREPADLSPVRPRSGICPVDPARPMLEPEALQVTKTAFENPAAAQARHLADGAGVTVGWLADGIDIHNPDFIRADGRRVFVDYRDFTGEGPTATTGGAEAFGDASAIAAQGRVVYDLADFVNRAHPLPAGCTITVLGVAPGANLVGLKVFGANSAAPTSRIIQAIDYAVTVANVDVLNESFGANPYPDTGQDPITLADEAAVAAGVTVVASTGDAGPNGTFASPATSAQVISVAASTTLRSYQQEGYAGTGLSNGTWADGNMSALSSGGVSYRARVPDLAAPGDLGWALCSPDVARYRDCTDDTGGASPIQNFGGTSQSAPLTAGAAALVIQAYRRTHGGIAPPPALVKRLLTSTATDLGHPAAEQGAGLLNTLAAVQGAQSWADDHGRPIPHGGALVVSQTQLSVVAGPGSQPAQAFAIRNVSATVRVVHASTRTVGRVLARRSGRVRLNVARAPTYRDASGALRSYVGQTFVAPRGADRLEVSAAAPTPDSPIRIILVDPQRTYQAYSIPQGIANYARVAVHRPAGGTWTAYFAVSRGSGFNAMVRYSVTASSFTTAGRVTPSTVVLPPGATATLVAHPRMPTQPGDTSASVQLTTVGGATTSIPMTMRALVPAGNTTFTAVITGGNGRQPVGPAHSTVYYLTVPAGQRDLAVAVRLPDPTEVVFGVLTAPDGQVSSYQSNVDIAPSGRLVGRAGLQLYRRDPPAGRWTLSLDVTNPVSGLELRQRFTVRVAYNTVRIRAVAPPDWQARLRAGVAVRIGVQITNTSNLPLSYFADARLAEVGEIRLAELSGGSAAVAVPTPTANLPFWLVPTQTTQLSVTATADQPVSLDVFYSSGNPERYRPPSGRSAAVRIDAAQLPPGLWAAELGPRGPFDRPVRPGAAMVRASARGRLFDPSVRSSTGDVWLAGLAAPGELASARTVGGATSQPAPVTIAAHHRATITVTITPAAAPGAVIRGDLFVDTFDDITNSGDELVRIPYGYTAAPAPSI